MKCPKCGTENLEDVKFCSNCGSQIGESTADEDKIEFVQPTAEPRVEPKKKKGKLGIVIVIIFLLLVAIVAVILLLVAPKSKKIEYRDAYQDVVAIGKVINSSFSSDSCDKVVKYEKTINYKLDEYMIFVDKCKDSYGISLLPEVEKLGKTDAVKRDKEIKEQYDLFKAEYDKIYEKSIGLEDKLNDYQNMHKFKLDTAPGKFSFERVTDAEIDSFAENLEKISIIAIKQYAEEWKEKYKAHAAVMHDMSTDLNNMVSSTKQYTNSAEWDARYNVSIAEKKAVDAEEPTVGDYHKLPKISYYDLNREYKVLRTLIASKYQENYKFGTNDCDEKDGTVVCN